MCVTAITETNTVRYLPTVETLWPSINQWRVLSTQSITRSCNIHKLLYKRQCARHSCSSPSEEKNVNAQLIDSHELSIVSRPDDDRVPISTNAHFQSLVDAAVSEITARCPNYFWYSSLKMGQFCSIACDAHEITSLSKFSIHELQTALVRGIQLLDDRELPITLDSEDPDEISKLVMYSILDAYAAVKGTVRLYDSIYSQQDSATPIDERCCLRKTYSGVEYAESGSGSRPLIVLSPTGTPLRIWTKFINDPDLDYRWYIISSRAGSLIEGGTPNASSLEQDVADIREVFAENNLNSADIVAWCNGSRAAIALTAESPELISSILLVSPTFHGALNKTDYPSPFEDGLVNAFNAIEDAPHLANYLLDDLVDTKGIDAAVVIENEDRRAAAVLRLPPLAHSQDLVLPLADTHSFRNYMSRVVSDELQDIKAQLRKVTVPTIVLNGTHDAAINPDLTRAIMAQQGAEVFCATLIGAGHHSHMIQYRYFKYLLDKLYARQAPVSTARLRVERLRLRN